MSGRTTSLLLRSTAAARVAGHLWTLGPKLRHRLRPVEAPAAVPWSVTVEDPRLGPVAIHGLLRERAGSDTVVVLVHGLGGGPQSDYMRRGAAAVDGAGLSCLRLGMRGADGTGEDLYHAGLTGDLRAALASAALARYRRVLPLGFSLGGHVCLAAAIEGLERRVPAVAAVCAPLDLAATQRHIDRRGAWAYRRYLLSNLKGQYEALAARRPGLLPAPAEAIRAADSIREWDRLVVVPRHGFADVDDYYRRASVSGRIERLTLPALLVVGRFDPMVPPETLEPTLRQAPPNLEVSWAVGGHVGFPRGDPADGGALAWLLRQG